MLRLQTVNPKLHAPNPKLYKVWGLSRGAEVRAQSVAGGRVGLGGGSGGLIRSTVLNPEP